jgi:hypothetical protein
MAREGGLVGRRQILISALATPLAVACGVGRGAGAGIVESAILLATGAVGMAHPKLVKLQAGTLIDDKPPTGWSHLVLRSIPRLATGDRDTLPAGSAKTATMFRSVLLVDVKPVNVEEKEFELSQIGLGVCVPVPHDETHDVVVTADRLDALGLRFSTVQRAVLDASEAEMAEGRIIARTPTFALFRSPVTVVTGNEHRKLNIYYAFCVERMTGRLRVAVWTMRPESRALAPPATMVKLGSKPVYECELDVRVKRIFGAAIPLTWSFAMRSLPPGSTVRVSAQLGQMVVAAARHPADVDLDELERLFHENLTSIPDADKDRTAKQPGQPSADTSIRRTAIPPPYRQLD